MKIQTPKILLFALLFCANYAGVLGQNLEWVYQSTGAPVQIGQFFTDGDNFVDMVVEDDGSIVVLGLISEIGDVDFYPTTHNMGEENLFTTILCKYNEDAELIWSTPVLRSETVVGGFHSRLAQDPEGNLYVVSQLDLLQDVDPGVGIDMLSPSAEDGILLKYNSEGEYQWAVHLESEVGYYTRAVSVNGEGNVVISGMISGTVDFDPGPGEVLNDTGDLYGNAPFVATYDSDGNYLWSVTLGQVPETESDTYANITGMAIDSENSIYLGGELWGELDADPGPGVAPVVNSGLASNNLVIKLDDTGNYEWSFTMPGVDEVDWVQGLLVDAGDNLYVSGTIGSANTDFDPGPEEFLLSPGDFGSAYLAKYSPAGELIHAFLLDTYGGLWPWAVALDENENIAFCASILYPLDLDPGPGEDVVSASERNAVICKYDAEGNYLSSMMIEGTGKNYIYCIEYNSNGSFYVGGRFQKTADFNPGPDQCLMHSNVEPIEQDNTYDGFLAKYTVDCTPADSLDLPMESVELCTIETVQIDIPEDVELNNACSWFLYQGSCGSTPLDSSKFGPFFIEPTESGWWFVGAGGECAADQSCDSIFIDVYQDIPTIMPDVEICEGDSAMIFGEYQTDAGLYDVVLFNENGCDSTVQQTLVVTSMNIQIQQVGATLEVLNQAGTYQWIDCDTGEPVEGATNPVFVPEQSGSYAVEVTFNNCTAISACKEVDITVSVVEREGGVLRLFPNPTRDKVWFETQYVGKNEIYGWQLCNLHGSILDNGFNRQSARRFPIDLTHLSAGVYYIKVHGDFGSEVFRLIKE